MNRFAKGIFSLSFLLPLLSCPADIDTIDNLIGDSLRLLSVTVSSIIGAIILISIVLPWFLLVVFFILICYFYAAFFYRTSAREIKVCSQFCLFLWRLI